MPNINNRVKLWRGTRANYNNLGTWDYWTEYNVKEEDGTWSKYYGTKKVVGDVGELAPVEGILSPEEFASLDASGKAQGTRWLVGSGSSYYVVEFGPESAGTYTETTKIQPLGSYSVRVKDRGLRAYELVDDELFTYDILFSSSGSPTTSQTLDEVIFEEDEGVITASIIVDEELDENSSHPVANSAIAQIISEDERITAAALNDLNQRKADKSYVDSAVSDAVDELDSTKADKTYVDDAIASAATVVVNCGSTVPVNSQSATTLATVGGTNITAKTSMATLTIIGAKLENGFNVTDGTMFDGTTNIEIVTLDCGEY